jgi:hypothetical protein
MTSVFCCSSIQPYRPQRLLHEDMFTAFMNWAAFPRESSPEEAGGADHFSANPSFAIQLVRQVNYGPIEAKRYFVPKPEQGAGFVEVLENDLIEANFKKENTYVLRGRLELGLRDKSLTCCSYKNWRCEKDNKFFEVNVYRKDPLNKHHWRANIARPADQIDL